MEKDTASDGLVKNTMMQTCLRYTLLALVTLAIVASNAFAADVTVDFEPNNPVVGQTARLIVIVKNGTSDSQPKIPDIKGFEVLSTSTSTNISFINGKRSFTKEFAYQGRLTAPGSLHIPAIEVTDGNDHDFSEPLVIEVKEPSTIKPDERAEQGYFSTATLSKSTAYVGEQIILTVKLYYRIQASNVQFGGVDDDLFWVRDLGEPETSLENVGDSPFYVVTLKRALFPKNAGLQKVGPFLFDFKVLKDRSGQQQLLDRFFSDRFMNFGIRETVSAVSNPIELEVLPLPSENRPPNFTGLVGDVDFRLETKLGKSDVRQGQSITVKATLSGNANMRGDFPVDWAANTNMKIYPDKEVLDERVEVYRGVETLVQDKSVSLALVPLVSGSLNLGPYTVAVFNPESKTYQRVVSNTLNFNVSADPNFRTLDVNSPFAVGEGANRMRTDEILNNHTVARILKSGHSTPLTWWLLLYFIVPLSLVVLDRLWLANRAFLKAGSTVKKTRKKKLAVKRALKNINMKEAKQLLEAHQLVTEYLQDRFGLSSNVITPADLRQRLPENAETDELVKQLMGLLNSLEGIRFGVAIHDDKFAAKLYHLVDQLDKRGDAK